MCIPAQYTPLEQREAQTPEQDRLSQHSVPHDPAQLSQRSIGVANAVGVGEHGQQPFPLAGYGQLPGAALLRPDGRHHGQVIHLPRTAKPVSSAAMQQAQSDELDAQHRRLPAGSRECSILDCMTVERRRLLRSRLLFYVCVCVCVCV